MLWLVLANLPLSLILLSVCIARCLSISWACCLYASFRFFIHSFPWLAPQECIVPLMASSLQSVHFWAEDCFSQYEFFLDRKVVEQKTSPYVKCDFSIGHRNSHVSSIHNIFYSCKFGTVRHVVFKVIQNVLSTLIALWISLFTFLAWNPATVWIHWFDVCSINWSKFCKWLNNLQTFMNLNVFQSVSWLGQHCCKSM